MTTFYYPKIGFKVKLKYKDEGKWRTKTENFWQTKNPWNKNTVDQILEITSKEADNYVKEFEKKFGSENISVRFMGRI